MMCVRGREWGGGVLVFLSDWFNSKRFLLMGLHNLVVRSGGISIEHARVGRWPSEGSSNIYRIHSFMLVKLPLDINMEQADKISMSGRVDLT